MSIKKKVKCLVSRLLVALGLKSVESCKAPALVESDSKKPVVAARHRRAGRAAVGVKKPKA